MKKAFSLLELVIAIVIISIAAISVPVIVQQSAFANHRSLLQEVVLNAKTRLSLILRSNWTCASGSSYDTVPFFYHLDPNTNTNTNEYAKNFYEKRFNIPANGNFSPRRTIKDYTGIQDFNAESKDCSMYHFNNKTVNILIKNDAGAGGSNAKRDFLIKSDYSSKVDFAPSGPSEHPFDIGSAILSQTTSLDKKNLRRITLKATSLNDVDVKLYAFSFNIGESPSIDKKSVSQLTPAGAN